MHDELFKVPTVVARYQAGPYMESREQFLKKARADALLASDAGAYRVGVASRCGDSSP